MDNPFTYYYIMIGITNKSFSLVVAQLACNSHLFSLLSRRFAFNVVDSMHEFN